MRLIKTEIRGFRRLARTSVNLDAALVAVVGPNEAGKTSLLNAISRVHDGSGLAPGDACRSDTAGPTDDLLVAHFVLDADDVDAVGHLDLDEPPLRVTLRRKVQGGTPTFGVTPSPRSRQGPLSDALAALGAFDPGVDLAPATPTPQKSMGAPPDGRDADVAAVLAVVARVVAGDHEDPDDDVAEARTLADRLGADPGRPWLQAIHDVVTLRRRPDPEPDVRNILFERIPKVLVFDEAARSLAGSYALAVAPAGGYPPALLNLASLAGLDLPDLQAAVAAVDIGRANTLVGRANRRLTERFSAQWRQSVVTVHLTVDSSRLHVLVREDDDLVTELDERSSGLRMFVALAAFVAGTGSTVRPILLIDEAETHLHYDAQADLVNVLATQTQACQVVYTTHSRLACRTTSARASGSCGGTR